MTASSVRWFSEIGLDDIPTVGGKTAALGEMYRTLLPLGVRQANGFAVTARAYRDALDKAGAWAALHDALDGLDKSDTAALRAAGERCRRLVYDAGLPPEAEAEARAAWRDLAAESGAGFSVAVRSSATAEDLPGASFAGQHDTYLNVVGEDAAIDAIRRCNASLFTDRAISYRIDHGFDHFAVSLSACVMRMVRADRGASGVMFTIDTETGHPDFVMITACLGLGENIVQGAIDPDEFLVHKPTFKAGARAVTSRRLGAKQLTMVYADEAAQGAVRNDPTPDDKRARFAIPDNVVMTLADYAIRIEDHFSERHGQHTPMDIEWALDGGDDAVYVLQARPETAASRRTVDVLETYTVKAQGTPLVTGRAVGSAAAAGRARLVRGPQDLDSFRPGEVLVADTTSPDWEPVMKTAAAIVADRGGRTCHAAIVARELGIPAVVGATDATRRIEDGESVTVSCAEGPEGRVYRGEAEIAVERVKLGDVPKPPVEVMVNLGNPDLALETSALPVAGVGLARLEFIIGEQVRAHPMALIHPDRIADPDEADAVRRLTDNRASGAAYFVERLSEGVGLICAAFWPRPVIARLSDFKSNEYARLLGGAAFEAAEENPMLGFRGAARYTHPAYAEGFALECAAMRRVRGEMGLTNLKLMIPFCRRVEEADRVLAVMAGHGLRSGEDGLEIYVMCEIPSNVLSVDAFAERFDGFSIGSNDLTQLTLGVDRDSALVADAFDERDPAVKTLLRMAVEGAHRNGRHVGICGQAPSDYPEMARFLVECGIDSISLTPDSVLRTLRMLGG
jgi:pyruvate,water dikinase